MQNILDDHVSFLFLILIIGNTKQFFVLVKVSRKEKITNCLFDQSECCLI